MTVKTLILLALSVSAQRSRLDVHTENDNDTRSDRYLNACKMQRAGHGADRIHPRGHVHGPRRRRGLAPHLHRDG